MKDRFWSKVDKSGKCWEWRASVNRRGYGQFKMYDRGNGKQKVMEAHRVAWLLENGDIPNGMCVCHKCDNTKCVRLSHLFLGTNKDNMQDMVQKGRKRGCRQYSDHLVRRIRRVYALGLSSTHIAKILDISRYTVCQILIGRCYKNTGGPLKEAGRRSYGSRFKNSETENSRSAARFLTSCKN